MLVSFSFEMFRAERAMGANAGSAVSFSCMISNNGWLMLSSLVEGGSNNPNNHNNPKSASAWFAF